MIKTLKKYFSKKKKEELNPQQLTASLSDPLGIFSSTLGMTAFPPPSSTLASLVVPSGTSTTYGVGSYTTGGTMPGYSTGHIYTSVSSFGSPTVAVDVIDEDTVMLNGLLYKKNHKGYFEVQLPLSAPNEPMEDDYGGWGSTTS